MAINPRLFVLVTLPTFVFMDEKNMPGASWAQRREEFAKFAESHDIAEQGLDVELRQLSRKHHFGQPSTKGSSLELSALKAEPRQQDTNSKSNSKAIFAIASGNELGLTL
jgi:hypothetical protein